MRCACGFARSHSITSICGCGAAVSGSSVTITWSRPSGPVTHYVLEAGSGPGLSNITVFNVGAATSVSVPAVPPGTYYVRVRAAILLRPRHREKVPASELAAESFGEREVFRVVGECAEEPGRYDLVHEPPEFPTKARDVGRLCVVEHRHHLSRVLYIYINIRGKTRLVLWSRS